MTKIPENQGISLTSGSPSIPADLDTNNKLKRVNGQTNVTSTCTKLRINVLSNKHNNNMNLSLIIRGNIKCNMEVLTK